MATARKKTPVTATPATATPPAVKVSRPQTRRKTVAATPAAPDAELTTEATTTAAPVVEAPAPAVPEQPTPEAAPTTDSLPEEGADKAKTKKPKLVRDSFTIPKSEYAVLDDLKTRATGLGMPVKKSELLRAGIKALAAMSDAAFAATLGTVPTIKTGRPKGEKA